MSSTSTTTSSAVILSEGVGTFVFVLIGAGAVCVDQGSSRSVGLLGTALASGFALTAMTYAVGRNGETHLNPAVTVAALLCGRTRLGAAGYHILAQLCGAALAGVALRLLFPDALSLSRLGAPHLASGLSMGRAATAEAVVGFAWVFTVAATCWRPSATNVGPIALGFVYATCVLFLGTVTGASGNPARAFGPAFASGTYTDHPVFWIGPIAGGCVAVVAYVLLIGNRKNRPSLLPEPTAEAPDAVYRRGVTLFRDGRLEEAAHQFSEVNAMRPEWPEPYYYIGMVYRELGDDANANAFFDAALHYRFALMERDGGKHPWR